LDRLLNEDPTSGKRKWGQIFICALAIVMAVRQLGIEVRAGVHTGECELMGDNVGGIAIHTGARIMAKAEPGAVLWNITRPGLRLRTRLPR
jgi:hypothetical protein